MIDKEKLLKLKEYSEMLVGSAKWVDGTVDGVMKGSYFCPKEFLQEAFECCIKDMEEVKKILDVELKTDKYKRKIKKV
jgi:hypothetical protein